MAKQRHHRLNLNVLVTIARWLSKPIIGFFQFLGWYAGNSKNRKRLKIGAAITVIAVGIAAELALDARHLPWHPLDIDDRAGFSTDMKLSVIQLGPNAWCRNLLTDSTTLTASPVAPLDADSDCGWSEAYDIGASGAITLSGTPPYAMQCGLAAGAHIWLTSVNARAREILGSDLTRIRHYGTYSCRRMYGRRSGPMSEHAYANAWDVSAFELADGSVVSVLADWQTNGPRRAFLRAVRDDACDIFDVVLGPDFNDAHRDHFHLDMGRSSRCR